MRNILLFLSLIMLPVSAWAQGLTIQGRVVDAETGEALPYVSIYAGEGKGTLSNNEGEFKLVADEGDMVSFRCIGYNIQTVSARQMPDTIRLKPYTTSLREVTVQVMSSNIVLKQTINNLKQDYKKQGKIGRTYFYRTMTEMEKGTFIVEAFLKAYSVVNIRSATILSGLQGRAAEDDEDMLNFNHSNAHRLIEVGPATHNSQFWQKAIKPLYDYHTLCKHYDINMLHMHGEDGKSLYKIELSWKANQLPEYRYSRNITGTAYVDAETCRLLRFDGSCNNYSVRYGTLLSYPTTINFHLEYDYSQGAASVSHLAVYGGTEMSYYRSLLFAIDKDELQQKKIEGSGSNIVTAVQDAGFDSTLWEKYDIVKRTQEEEKAAFGQCFTRTIDNKSDDKP